MRKQINSLVVVSENILQESRATDIVLIKAGKQSNLYATGVKVVSCNKISDFISQSLMAEMMV